MVYSWWDFVLWVLIPAHIFFVVIVLWIRHRQRRDRCQDRYPPFISGWMPFIGCGLEFFRRGPSFLKDLQQKVGGVFTLYAGGKYITFILDKDYYKRFYKGEGGDINLFAAIRDTILVHLSGKEFYVNDEESNNPTFKLITTHITPNTSSFFDTVVRQTESLLPRLLEQNTKATGKMAITDVTKFFTLLLLRCSVIPCFMGQEFAENLHFLRCITGIHEIGRKLITKPPFMLPFLKRYVDRCRYLRTRAIEMIVGTLAERRRNNQQGEDFLSIMARHGQEHHEPDVAIATRMLGIMTAILANTPSTFLWTFLQLIAHKEILKDVLQEQQEVMAATGGKLEFGMLSQMELLGSCMYESLRMYSPLMHVRKVLKTFTYKGFDIREGDLLCVSPQLAHHDEAHYHDPYKYNPDRWRDDPPRHTFHGWGAGEHKCVGKYFATMAIKTIVTIMLRDYEWTGPEPDALPGQGFFNSLGVSYPSSSAIVHYKRVES